MRGTPHAGLWPESRPDIKSSSRTVNEETLPESTSDADGPRVEPPFVIALVLAWSAEEPRHIGEVAIPPPGAPGQEVVWGRRGDAPGGRRLLLQRHRPGRIIPTGEVTAPKVSHNQLRMRALSDEALEVQSVGRAKVLHNGLEVASFRAIPGDVIEIGRQVVLLVVRKRAFIMGPALDDAFPFGGPDAHGIVGESPEIWELRRRIAFVGTKTGHVLLRGESGTGKELVARALHSRSARAGRPLLARSAATLPESIIDAELFGNLKNYPNPGTPERAGLVGEAHESTLFLDEIGEISQGVQAHLLRVLDDGEYHRLGEARARRSDLRLIGATNRLESSLKHDLAARFVFRMEVPNLNERRQDIPLIALHLLRQIATHDATIAARFFAGDAPQLSPTLVRHLIRWPFTTNVCELAAIVWQALTESTGGRIEAPAGLGAPSAGDRPEREGHSSLGQPRVEDPAAMSAAAIQACLDAHNGVIEDAWRPLGLPSRHALARLIKKHDVEIRKKPR